MNIRIATRAVVFAFLTSGVAAGSVQLAAQEGAEPAGADTLYREARQLLNQRSYERALQLFRQVQREHAASEFAAQSAYWEAYSLYRLGGADRLREAMAVLEQRLAESHETATGHRDAAELRARINSLLAGRGDVEGFQRLWDDAVTDDGCDREALGVRMEALRALSRLDSELALPSVIRLLGRQDECAVELRRQAVMLIPQVAQQTQAESLLANVVRTDPSLPVQLSAVLMLGQFPTEMSVALLAQTAREHDSQRMRQQALMALTRAGSGRGTAVLRQVAADEDADERDRLVAIAGLLNDGASRGFLRELYASTNSMNLKSQLLQLLGGPASTVTADWFMEIARDSSVAIELRNRALFQAAQGDIDLSQLIEMYEHERDPALLESLVMVFSRYQARDPRALDVIIDIARNGEYPGLRRRAIAMLVRSDSPRAAQVMVELLEQ